MLADSRIRHRREMARLKEAYLREVPEKVASLRREATRLLQSKDAQAFASFFQATHRLAGSAAIFGLSELSAAARELERRLGDFQPGAVSEALRTALESGLSRLEAALGAGSDEPQPPSARRQTQ